MESIYKLKYQIDDEYNKYNEKNTNNDLETITLQLSDMLAEFYEKLSMYMAERLAKEKGQIIPFPASARCFYHYISAPRYGKHLYRNYLEKYNTANEVIDSLVFETRKRICNNRYLELGDEYLTEQQCVIASIAFQKEIEKQKNIEGRLLATSTSFGMPNNAHAFNYLDTGNRQFIADCSFSQFTKLYRMTPDIIKIPKELTNAEPAYFLLQTEEGKELLNQLLTVGYFELTPKNLKLYLDSFVLSNRNAGYYLSNDTSLFESEISSEYYMNQLNVLLKYSIKTESGILRNPEILSDEFNPPECFGFKDYERETIDDFLTKEDIKTLNKKLKK